MKKKILKIVFEEDEIIRLTKKVELQEQSGNVSPNVEIHSVQNVVTIQTEIATSFATKIEMGKKNKR